MKNKSLRFKLYLLSGFLLLVSIIVGGVGYWASNNIIKNYSKVANWNLPNTRYIYEILMQSRQARIFAFQLAIPGLPREQGLPIAAQVEKVMEAYDEAEKTYLKEPFGPGEEALWNDLKKPMEAIKIETLKLAEIYKKYPDENSAERKSMANSIFNVMDAHNTKARAAGAALRIYHENSAKENTALAVAAASSGTIASITTLLIGSLIGISFAVIFSNGLVRLLSSISDSLAEAGVQVGSGSAQIASASEELSEATTEQAASLEQTAASIEEMNSMIAKNTENAQKSTYNSKISQDNAIKGKGAVDQMINSIDDISKANKNIMDQIDHSNSQISEIVKVIGEIGNKTKVINDIVFQTKLLSFNASVEAARAGEHGKGFAVVAEEVGNLAQMSGNAAQEITAMLDESIKKVEGIVNETKLSVSGLIEEGKNKVEVGTRIAQQCGQVLEEIVISIETVSSMAQEISTASIEQSQGIGEITKAMNSLDQVTQQNSATSEEAASAAEELSAQADSLNSLVQELVMAVHGHSNMGNSTKSAFRAKEKTDKVVQIKPKAKAANTNQLNVKKASGDYSAPIYDDSRFTDV